uniref:Uncharacterized protein n=1 Tax=Meloidogyne enterolobii TaxID=390850 RepID=A0A6V7W901_MELEN|nr:unnamed protein product [Meloidogyne enterolobii]
MVLTMRERVRIVRQAENNNTDRDKMIEEIRRNAAKARERLRQESEINENTQPMAPLSKKPKIVGDIVASKKAADNKKKAITHFFHDSDDESEEDEAEKFTTKKGEEEDEDEDESVTDEDESVTVTTEKDKKTTAQQRADGKNAAVRPTERPPWITTSSQETFVGPRFLADTFQETVATFQGPSGSRQLPPFETNDDTKQVFKDVVKKLLDDESEKTKTKTNKSYDNVKEIVETVGENLLITLCGPENLTLPDIKQAVTKKNTEGNGFLSALRSDMQGLRADVVKKVAELVKEKSFDKFVKGQDKDHERHQKVLQAIDEGLKQFSTSICAEFGKLENRLNGLEEQYTAGSNVLPSEDEDDDEDSKTEPGNISKNTVSRKTIQTTVDNNAVISDQQNQPLKHDAGTQTEAKTEARIHLDCSIKSNFGNNLETKTFNFTFQNI